MSKADLLKIKAFVESTPYWRQVNRRIMRGAEKFGDDLPAKVCMAASLAVSDTPLNDDSARRIAECTVKMIEKNIPAFYIAPELLDAVRLSHPPNDLRWDQMHLPFDAALMIFPRDAIRHAEYGSVDFIGYGRIMAGETIETPERISRFENSAMTFFTAVVGEPNFPSQQRTLSDNVDPTVGGSIFTAEQALLTDDIYESEFSKYLTFDDAEFMNDLIRIAFGVLLAMSARPQLVARGQRQGRHKKSGLPIWTPNIVGRDYRYRSEPSDAGSGGTVRMHWRRGHFRHQPFGEGRREHKIIWIEPTLVGGSDDR